MLKSPTKTYQNNNNFANIKAKNGSRASKSPLSDLDVEQYIRLAFEKSPRALNGTAPAHEWLQFLDRFNEHQNYYLLTEMQKRAIKPYCDQNHDLEMTPEEFISLVLLIRHNNTPELENKGPSDTRPKVSTYLLSSSKSTMSYFDDRSSINHPDSLSRHEDQSLMDSDYPINNSVNNEQDNTSLLKTLKREKNLAARQSKEHESRIACLSKEHSERLLQFETRLENMKIEADQQKALVADYKIKERERLDKIAELKSTVDEYDSNHATALKKLQKKNDELEKLREKLVVMENAHTIASANAETALNQLKRTQGNEKNDYFSKLDQEKRVVAELRRELEQLQNENTKLMELIDKQKFDLDEARSGMRYYTNSPSLPMDNKVSSNQQSPTQEQLQADYVKKMKNYEEKLAEAQQKLHKAEQDAVLSLQIQDNQKMRLQTLSNQFDQQHALIDSIRLGLDHPSRPFYVQKVLSWVAYFFTFYHIILLIVGFLVHQRTMPHSLFAFSFLHDWQDYFYSHVNRPYF